MDHPNDGPAFPHPGNPGATDFRVLPSEGMTKRELFSMSVLPSILRNFWRGLDERKYDCPSDWRDGVANDACLLADALLRALAEPEPVPEPVPEPEPVPPHLTYNAWGAPSAEQEAIKRLAERHDFKDLPAVIRDFVNVATAEIQKTEDGIPF